MFTPKKKILFLLVDCLSWIQEQNITSMPLYGGPLKLFKTWIKDYLNKRLNTTDV